MIITKINYTEGPNQSQTRIEVIGYKDTATGFAVKPIGKINASLQRHGKPRATPLSNIVVSCTMEAG